MRLEDVVTAFKIKMKDVIEHKDSILTANILQLQLYSAKELQQTGFFDRMAVFIIEENKITKTEITEYFHKHIVKLPITYFPPGELKISAETTIGQLLEAYRQSYTETHIALDLLQYARELKNETEGGLIIPSSSIN